MISIKVTGLDKLQRELNDAQRAIKGLDGTITSIRIDSDDPASVQAAIRQMERAVDSKVAGYSRNPLVAPIVEAAKKHYRSEILKLAKSKK